MAESKGDTRFNSLKSLFESKTVLDIHPARNKVISVSSEDTPLKAFETLIENKILSAPVRNKDTGSYINFLDVRDLLSYVVFVYEFEEQRAKDRERSKELAREFLDLLLTPPRPESPKELSEDKAVQFRDPRHDISIKYLSARNRFVPVTVKDSVLKVAELLSHPDINRVPVLDESGNLVDIISQSALIKFMSAHHEELTPVLLQKLEDLGMARKPVVTVPETERAANVFKLMNVKRLSSVGVVDRAGRIIGNTSASDLKLFIQKPSLHILRLPIVEFINIIRQQDLKERIPVVSVRTTDTLGKAIGKLAATGIHRVFVVDADQKPVGVVSVSDIISRCFKMVKGEAAAPAAAPASPSKPASA